MFLSFAEVCLASIFCLFQTLRQWIAVESDSSDVTKRSDLHRMMDMTAEKLRLIGGSVEMVDVGTQSVRSRLTNSYQL